MIRSLRRRLLTAAGATLTLPGVARSTDAANKINFYFPTAVGGPITGIIDGQAADFQHKSPSVQVTPTYAGTYQDTLAKSLNDGSHAALSRRKTASDALTDAQATATRLLRPFHH